MLATILKPVIPHTGISPILTCSSSLPLYNGRPISGFHRRSRRSLTGRTRCSFTPIRHISRIWAGRVKLYTIARRTRARTCSRYVILSNVVVYTSDLCSCLNKQAATIAPKRKHTLNDNGEPRKKRTCPKCGDPNCKGASRRSYCNNQCQDCRQRDCERRNSKHPGKDCVAGKLLSGATGGRPRKTMS